MDELLGFIVLFPISFVYGLKHTRLKIPKIIALLSPLALFLVLEWYDYSVPTNVLVLVTSILAVFLGTQA